jgi:hypothetical protein
MLNFLKKLPWWTWLAAAIAIFILWQSISGWAASRKLYTMALDNLREDQSNVVRVLEENAKIYESELMRVTRELEALKQRQVAVRAENQRLAGRVYELEREREAIIVPNDPNQIVDGFRSLGFKSSHRRRR